ncbi:uncharacterized protein A4U43_C09F3770 [Asparagus officinalis]|uniref:TPX2 C-terminal domain-containing protein n=1 Tax=Asparagus officinalis TaxID=4686 RepID=A0A5P1E9W9_ASPOF|nr:protein WVD2-like 7 [Asparagus officinalis]ONK57756.1 uncharacterized protein A4U43_C09F3770 [Asparagus officinalis]
MAAYVDQAYYGWSHEELPRQEDSREASASQMLDHGSISFGRFAYESLSWERRSVFTYNKCQEEFEKFKSPGLVAKKKAYFEEHYKRIRAMKALQGSQQTEITLDYGGDRSFSSRTGDEEESAVQGVANAAAVQSEEAPAEDSMENGKDCCRSIEVQIGHSDSSTSYFEEHEREENVIHSHQMQHLDMDISARESLKVSIKESKQKDLVDRHDKAVSMENRTLDTNTETEMASRETTPCPTNSKEGDVELKPAHNMVLVNIMPAVRKYEDNVSVPTLKESTGPSRNGPKLEHRAKQKIKKSSQGPNNPIQKIVKSVNGVASTKATANKFTRSYKSISATSKLELEAKANIQKSSQGTKHPIPRQNADKVSRNYKATSASSHGPLTEVHSNVTIPRPFSLATDRRAAVPSGSREDAHKSVSKSSNQISSSAVKGKFELNFQGTSKQTVTSRIMKTRGLENERGHDEKNKPKASDSRLRARGTNLVTSKMESRILENRRGHEENKKLVTVDCQSSSLKARGASAPGPMKARSLNLPSRDKFSSDSGVDIRFNKGDGSNEGKLEAGVARFRRADTKNFTSSVERFRNDTKACTPLSAKVRTETKKATPSSTSNSSSSTRKTRFGEQSLDRKKLRQERPRWR